MNGLFLKSLGILFQSLAPVYCIDQWFPKWAVRNSRGAVKQKWAVGGDRTPS